MREVKCETARTNGESPRAAQRPRIQSPQGRTCRQVPHSCSPAGVRAPQVFGWPNLMGGPRSTTQGVKWPHDETFGVRSMGGCPNLIHWRHINRVHCCWGFLPSLWEHHIRVHSSRWRCQWSLKSGNSVNVAFIPAQVVQSKSQTGNSVPDQLTRSSHALQKVELPSGWHILCYNDCCSWIGQFVRPRRVLCTNTQALQMTATLCHIRSHTHSLHHCATVRRKESPPRTAERA